MHNNILNNDFSYEPCRSAQKNISEDCAGKEIVVVRCQPFCYDYSFQADSPFYRKNWQKDSITIKINKKNG